MTKQAFLTALRSGISTLPRREIEDRLDFYSEMIDDLIEEGHSEERAVARIGSVDRIAAQISEEARREKTAKSSKHSKKVSPWTVLLLILGSPIWLSLLIAAFSVLVSLLAALFSVVISLWASFAALVGSGIGGMIAGILFATNGHGITAIAILGASLVCEGLAVFFFLGCKALTIGAARLTKATAAAIARCFRKKEDKQ